MKKGFTLVELLAVITILGIIALLVSTSVIGTLNKTKSSLSTTQITTIEKAAEKWSIVNADKLPLDSSEYSVDINTLANDGYLDSSDLKNPKNNSKICGVVKINYVSEKKQYKYTFTSKTC